MECVISCHGLHVRLLNEKKVEIIKIKYYSNKASFNAMKWFRNNVVCEKKKKLTKVRSRGNLELDRATPFHTDI